MAHKRKAREAFTPQGQLSAFAAAKSLKQIRSSAPSVEPSRSKDVAISATEVAATPYEPAQSEVVEALIDVDSDDPASEDSPVVLERDTLTATTSFGALTVLHDDQKGVTLRLRTDESLSLVGEYDLQVLEGIVAVYGAVLRADQQVHRVCAPSLHGIPTITGRKEGSVIRLSSTNTGLRTLARLSPLFRSIWNSSDDEIKSFAILPQTAADASLKTASSLQITEGCRRVLSKINGRLHSDERAPQIMAVGAKSSGKSTFNRLMCNMIVSRPGAQRCFYLDLDPGQPEFGPPGVLSLVEVKAPVFGPSFSHHAHSRCAKLRLIRRHALASTTFSHDPDHYLACATDLIRHVPPDVPLVVNTCGWIAGVGANMLHEIQSRLQNVEVVFLDPVDNALVESLGRTAHETHRISRHPIAPSIRTPAEQRLMHTMSYFHSRQGTAIDLPRWTSSAISHMHPWAVSYSVISPGITAVVSYGQPPHSDFLTEVLEGSVVAIVTAQPGSTNVERIQRTKAESLPYWTANADGFVETLDPKYSECIGLALVRSVNSEQQEMELLTPLADAVVAKLAQKQVFLVRGGFDPADWALLEDHYLTSNGSEVLDVATPWISRREAMVGVEGAVWRLRHPPTRH